MSLDGHTPAERAGIQVKGTNKWMTIIQNAGQQTIFLTTGRKDYSRRELDVTRYDYR